MMPEKLRGWSSPFGCFIRAQRQFSAHSMPLLCPCERTGQVGPVLETDLTIEGRTKNSLCRPKLENIGPTCAAQTYTHTTTDPPVECAIPAQRFCLIYLVLLWYLSFYFLSLWCFYYDSFLFSTWVCFSFQTHFVSPF